MAILPKVKLKTIPVFPAAVEGGTAIRVTKESGEYTIDLDVTDIQVSTVAAADSDTTYAVSWAGATDDNPDGSYLLVPFAGFQGASEDLTSLADLGTTGIVARTGDALYATRTITAGTGLGVTNGGGVAGNPTVAITDAELLALAGLTSAADKLPYFTGSGTAALADFSAFGRLLVDDADAAAARTTLGLTSPATATPAALTRTNDTNVTLTLGGTPTTALLQATSITVGWSGTLAAARLNANVVQAVTNDTNVTGSIATQTVTLGWTGTLAAARGGTGTGSYAVGDLLYASTTSALSKLADVATGNALISGGVGVAPSWGKINLTAHVTGNLPVANLNAATQSDQETGTSTTTVITPGVQKYHPSAAKAWVYFDGKTGGVATIKSSFGVTSVVRNSAGNYTINWSTAFSSATAYAVQILCSDPNTTVGFPFLTGGSPLLAGSMTFQSRDALSPATAVDCAIVMICAFGDQ